MPIFRVPTFFKNVGFCYDPDFPGIKLDKLFIYLSNKQKGPESKNNQKQAKTSKDNRFPPFVEIDIHFTFRDIPRHSLYIPLASHYIPLAFGLHSAHIPLAFGLHPATFGLHPATFGLHPATFGLHPATFGLHPATSRDIQKQAKTSKDN